MISLLKNIDLKQIKNRVADLKSEVDDLRFQKPWSTSRPTSPLILLALGAGVAMVGVALYKKRSKVAQLCNQCGEGIRDKISGMNSSEYSKETPTHI